MIEEREFYLVRSDGEDSWLDRSLPEPGVEIDDPSRHLSARFFAKEFPTALDAVIAARRLGASFEVLRVRLTREEEVVEVYM